MFFLNLFAGAGGLSEGFIRAGFTGVAHVEVDKAACFTLRTRNAYHYMKEVEQEKIYKNYIYNRISREKLYKHVPSETLNSVLNCEINNENRVKIFEHVDNLLKDRKIDAIIGGPPCQAYSIVGRARDPERMVGDPRNYLYEQYAEFLKYYKPKFFVFENVLGLLSAKTANGVLYFDKMRSLFASIGYKTVYKVLNAADCGVPQNRNRVIIIGKLYDNNFEFPDIPKKTSTVTIEELFYDLPKVKPGKGSFTALKIRKISHDYLYEIGVASKLGVITHHVARNLNDRDAEIYNIAIKLAKKGKRLAYSDLPSRLKTHKNEVSFKDRFKVVDGKLTASHTVVAHLSKDGHYYIHPDIRQNRSITPREAARLQTFPDDYFFETISGKYRITSIYKQIGNAVPVLLAYEIATFIKESAINKI